MPVLPPNALFSACALLGFILAGIPLPWHIKSSNTGTSMYMVWTSLGCLILFVNSVVWNDNTINSAPVWCDISAHYLVGASVGIPASSSCIVRRLYHITKLETVSIKKAQRRRNIIVDISIGIGFPCVVMVLQYVVQSRRFVIYEQVGCYPYTTNTLLAYFLVLMWPLVIGLISFVYAVLTFRRAMLQKDELRKLLDSGFSINSRHYWRLMALCSMEILFTVPLSLYVIITDVAFGELTPYVSWSSMHAGFSQIPQVPTSVWESAREYAVGLESLRWAFILCAFVVSAFFGWTRDVRDFYIQTFWSVCRRLGNLRSPSSSLPTSTVSNNGRGFTYASESTFPIHIVDQRMRSKRLSTPIYAQAKQDCVLSDTFQSSEIFSSFSRLSMDNGVFTHMHTPSAGTPAPPEPALARDHFDVSHLI